jgi:solute carrier family 39 (zinc transporter), member 1/2/3
MEILHYQLIFIAAILATGLTAGLTPALTGAADRHERFFSLGNALGGGVFLGAGLIHLLPDASDNFSGLLGPDFDYPLASLICAGGFLLILLIERVIVGGDEERLAEASSSDDAMLPYVLALVLSVHSLIAGMALGAESQLATSLALFIAIIAHKGVAAFALGVSLERGAVRRSRSIGIVTLFSVMTPLGILAGAGLGALLSGPAEHWFEGTFDALAAGTFLYVAVVDIIGGEFSVRKDLWPKFMMVLVGLALMALVAVWT